MIKMSSLDEEMPGRICESCEADLSWLPDEAEYCCFCGNSLTGLDDKDNEDDEEDQRLLQIMLAVAQ